MADGANPDSVLSGEIAVRFAGLSDEGQEQVYEALELPPHALAEVDVREVVHDAEVVDYHNAQAEEFEAEQAKAAAAGNWELAKEYAQRAQGEREVAADHGAPDVPVAEAQADVASLENARWEQRNANENARAAASSVEAGDAATSEIYSGAAAHHQALADEHGHQGSGVLHEESGSSPARDDVPPEHTPDSSAGAASDAAQPGADHGSWDAGTSQVGAAPDPGVDATADP